MKLKKEIKKLINETKSSNKTLTRNNIDKGVKININNEYLTINANKSHERNIIDMKKNIDNKNDNNNNTIKSRHYRVKTLYNKTSYYNNKKKK
jgi:hypothetical protein